MIDQSKYQELDLLLGDINAEYRWRQMSDHGRKVLAAHQPERRWSNREIRDVRAAIERLPAVEATRREIPTGGEVPLGGLRRYYLNLTFEMTHGWDDMRFARVGMHGAATSLGNYMRRLGPIEAKGCSSVDVARHAAAASTVITQEFPASDREGNRYDFTTNALHIRMSRAAFAFVVPILKDAMRRRASCPEVVVILSADVDSSLNLATRQLEDGQGQTFTPVTSGPFQPVRWHVHLFEPPPWPVAGWQATRHWLPNDHAVDHPLGSWAIEEFAGSSRDNMVDRLASRIKAFWIQLDRPSA